MSKMRTASVMKIQSQLYLQTDRYEYVEAMIDKVVGAYTFAKRARSSGQLDRFYFLCYKCGFADTVNFITLLLTNGPSFIHLFSV